MATPGSSVFFGVPPKRPEESDAEYQQRIQIYMQGPVKRPEAEESSTAPKPRPDEGRSFKLPEDKDAFEAYAKAHPEVKWSVECENQAGLQEMLKYGQQLGIVNNIVGARLRDQNLFLFGAELQKEKDAALQGPDASQKDATGRPRAGFTQWPPRPRPPGTVDR